MEVYIQFYLCLIEAALVADLFIQLTKKSHLYIDHVIGIPQTAVTQDFYKQSASWACLNIYLTQSFPAGGV